MKCPNCRFVCSELRDICPKCLLDLRPHKSSLALPISFPDLSYAELTAKIMKKPLSDTPPKEPEIKLLSSLKEFGRDVLSAFSPSEQEQRQEQATQEMPEDKGISNSEEVAAIDALDKSVIDADQEIDTSSPTTNKSDLNSVEDSPQKAPTVLDLSNSQDNLSEILDQMIGETEIEIETIKPEEIDDKIEFDFVMDDDDSTSETEDQTELPPIGNLASSTDIYVEPEATPEENVLKLETELSTIENEAIFADSEQLILTDLSTNEKLSTSPERPDACDQTSTLFEEAAKEIAAYEKDWACELELFQLRPITRTQELDLLFDLTAEEIANPEKSKKYVTELPSSVEQVIDSPELNQQLKIVEKAVSTPLFTLRNSFKKQKEENGELNDKRPLESQRTMSLSHSASSFQRFYCLLVDFVALIFLALCVTIILGLTSGTFPSEILIDPTVVGPVELLSLFSDFLVAIILGLIIYPLLSCLIAQQTVGMKMAGIKMIDYCGEQPSKQQIFIRALSWPISLLFAGIVGRRDNNLLHDRAAWVFLISTRKIRQINNKSAAV